MSENGRYDGPEEDWEAELGEMVARLEIEKAPATLTRRLMRIPQEYGKREPWWSRWLPQRSAPRWVLIPALAAIPLLVIGLVLMQPRQPSRAEVEKARQDLAIAFSYLDKVGLRTTREIQDVLEDGLEKPVKGELRKYMPYTGQPKQEKAT
ncbi:MAG: hypothetical protein PVJ33_09755 [Lysobacterales bacterium]|jgi:hypothetical protein